MIRWGTILLEIAVAAVIFWLCFKVSWCKLKHGVRIIVLVAAFCVMFISFSAASAQIPKQTLTLTALGEKNDHSRETSVYLVDIVIDGSSQGILAPVSGQWSWYHDHYCWFERGDVRFQEGTTESVTFELPIAPDVELIFLGNDGKGVVSIEVDGLQKSFDTYSTEGDSVRISFPLPDPSFAQVAQAILRPSVVFGASFLLLCVFLTVTLGVGQVIVGKFFHRYTDYGLLQKLRQYQFLFEELVKRDFKKKYKRTVLGMVWSVLSPLLTLLVMRVVFTQFFGRNVDHYTTYLFCGNLVFSYFNESTSQGMTALLGNANIFTKVNVPKYLFLFSKNVQTLINFCLTLCVFFAFCIMDQIAFTWRFVFLLYPICLLVLFNIGMGLILSAFFIFFRDIQYLWLVFTQLLMYMSAIFYTIDSYSYEIQCAFLLNPVYLFIRYFRKIVIEATIPTIWFHLLMAADVLIVLGLGCWMYKKYNTKFLYYV